jgi:hypothetical protein
MKLTVDVVEIWSTIKNTIDLGSGKATLLQRGCLTPLLPYLEVGRHEVGLRSFIRGATTISDYSIPLAGIE